MATPISVPQYLNIKLTVENEGRLVICSLNRPSTLNTLHPHLVRDFHSFLDWLAVKSNPCRVVILRGEGKGFCAGADLSANYLDRESNRKSFIDDLNGFGERNCSNLRVARDS
jgi:enoyl-CoA hydratase/carnithine racemase